ncbi:MAG: cls [Cyanobacteria bacterium RYN_339]|nr:cls [Cyanobacteria bacterium RYN_339]
MAIDARRPLVERKGSPIGNAVLAAAQSTQRSTIAAGLTQRPGAVVGIWKDELTTHNEAIDQVCKLIAGAKDTIFIQEFAWDYGGEACKQLLDALAAQQRKYPGLKIRIAYDRDMFALPWSMTLPKALAAHGVQAQLAGYSTNFLGRSVNHTKMFIIDGKVGVTGGSNVQNHPWRDMFVGVEGPVVGSMLADFQDAWTRSRAWTDVDGRALATAPTLPAVKLDPSTEGRRLVPMTVLTKRGGEIDGERSRDNAANQGLLAAYKAATRVIKVESPNCNDPDVWNALAAAAARGVKVQVLLSKNFNQLRSQFDRASNDRFLRFVAKLPAASQANVEMRWYSSDGHTTAGNHTKYTSIDGQWAYVGSQNMDNQSWAWSREMGLGIDDATETARLDGEVFDDDWRTSLRAKPSFWDHILPQPARDWGARIVSWVDPRAWLAEFVEVTEFTCRM